MHPARPGCPRRDRDLEGANISDNHASQINVGGMVINVAPGKELTQHPDGSLTMTPAHVSGGHGGGGASHPDYLQQRSHGPQVEHWQTQLNSVMQAGMEISG